MIWGLLFIGFAILLAAHELEAAGRGATKGWAIETGILALCLLVSLAEALVHT